MLFTALRPLFARWPKILMATALGLVVVFAGCSESTSSEGEEEDCDLLCDVSTDEYSLGITCESGGFTTEFNSETTEYHYSGATRTGFTLHLNRTITFHDSGRVYVVTGTITVDQINDTVTYDIDATGGAFGSAGASCSG